MNGWRTSFEEKINQEGNEKNFDND